MRKLCRVSSRRHLFSPLVVGVEALVVLPSLGLHVPGLIILFTGIQPICKDEQGLAAVLAHGTFFLSLAIPPLSSPTSEVGHVGQTPYLTHLPQF